jgi:hypothetical protein
VRIVDHRFALGNNPASLSAPEKIVHERQLAEFGVQRLQVNCRLGRPGMAIRFENPCGRFQQLTAPVVIWFGWTSNCCAARPASSR